MLPLVEEIASNEPDSPALDDAFRVAMNEGRLHAFSSPHFFDAYLLHSARAGTLPIDLRGEVVLGDPVPNSRMIS